MTVDVVPFGVGASEVFRASAGSWGTRGAVECLVQSLVSLFLGVSLVLVSVDSAACGIALARIWYALVRSSVRRSVSSMRCCAGGGR
jgi:hypothetical protein